MTCTFTQSMASIVVTYAAISTATMKHSSLQTYHLYTHTHMAGSPSLMFATTSNAHPSSATLLSIVAAASGTGDITAASDKWPTCTLLTTSHCLHSTRFTCFTHSHRAWQYGLLDCMTTIKHNIMDHTHCISILPSQPQNTIISNKHIQSSSSQLNYAVVQ